MIPKIFAQEYWISEFTYGRLSEWQRQRANLPTRARFYLPLTQLYEQHNNAHRIIAVHKYL